MKIVIVLAVILAVAALARSAFAPGRGLPRNRVRHARVRLRLRLHPGRGMATTFELWLRWGRFAAWRKSGRIRPSLSAGQRMARPRETRSCSAAPITGTGCTCRWKSTCC